MRDEAFFAAHVVPAERLDRPIRLAEYDPAWPTRYEREATRIRGALGGRVLLLEHVGSTSVPGLAAKPIIDILLVVADPADEASYVPALEEAGYVLHLREPEWFEHRMFRGGDTELNLHVLPPRCSEVDRFVGFRDRLRTIPEDRVLYERRKRELAARVWAYGQDYADAKNDVVDEICARAGLPQRAEPSTIQPSAGSGGTTTSPAMIRARRSSICGRMSSMKPPL
jgi:GrpB-like predicted nucleotidyltransferase (UPF0157 family)